MSTTFDGSNSSGYGPTTAAEPEGVETDVSGSMLAQLRDRVAEARAVKESWVHVIKDAGIRITCDPNIEEDDYKAWLRAALPKQRGGARRRGAMPDMTRLAQTTLSALTIINTCEKVEMLGSDNKTWSTLREGGKEIGLDSPEMASLFNIPDPIELLRMLFGRDARLINAGEDLLTEAGYMPGDDEDESDPT